MNGAPAAMVQCRSCGHAACLPVLDLGCTPLANRLLTREALAVPEPAFPLRVVFCPCCSLVQLAKTVPPEQLFEEYPYLSSVSDTVVDNAREACVRIRSRRALDDQSLVVEIASNDGYLLQNFVEAGIPVLGIEPAGNIARVAEERGVRTLNRFFSAELGAELAGRALTADVIVANNVMAHIPDVNGVLKGIERLLAPGGIFVMETPYIGDLIEQVEFDTIYHEHVFYYSLTALECLFRRHELAAAEVERIPIHGGSLRVTATHAGHEGEANSVHALLAEEAGTGLLTPEHYRDFGERVRALGTELVDLLRRLKAGGARIAAYGAAAKGSTLLNAFGIGADLLDFVVDRSPLKQGRFTPGIHLPILQPEYLLEAMPEYALLLTWNFADEILSQQAEYRRLGGKFIVPVPWVRIV